MRLALALAAAGLCLAVSTPLARGDTTLFFDSSQGTTLVNAGVTSDTIESAGYRFTYTRDKLFTGGVGLPDPIGRAERVSWPDGLEAQAVTAGPTLSAAKLTISRADGDLFDLVQFTTKLLANTAGAGGNFEVMPTLNGEDGFKNPLMFFGTGIAGNTWTYNETTPAYLGNTTPLKGFETYTITLYVDYAVMGLTLEGPPVAVPEAGTLGLLALGAVATTLQGRSRRVSLRKSRR
jgi:hypothetical protein